MDSGAFFGRAPLFIAALAVLGLGMIVISLLVNYQVARSVHAEMKHREKLLEYYRNTFSQLGIILIGIGVSLSVFYFQQAYQERARRAAELQQLLSKLDARVARGTAAIAAVRELDGILDAGGPYLNPADGGGNAAITARGPQLADQVTRLLAVERDLDVSQFEVLALSRDFEASPVLNEFNPDIWFNIARDESDVRYASAQLPNDFRALHQALGDTEPNLAVQDPDRAQQIKSSVLDIFYDADLLRRRSRRLLARACWMLAAGPGFVSLAPDPSIEKDAGTHVRWLSQSEASLKSSMVGARDCFRILRGGYDDDPATSW